VIINSTPAVPSAELLTLNPLPNLPAVLLHLVPLLLLSIALAPPIRPAVLEAIASLPPTVPPYLPAMPLRPLPPLVLSTAIAPPI